MEPAVGLDSRHLQAANKWHQLRNPTLGSQVRAAVTFLIMITYKFPVAYWILYILSLGFSRNVWLTETK